MEPTRGRRRRQLRASAVKVAAVNVVAVTILLAGCGGDNEIVIPKNRAGTTTTTEAPGDDPCKLLNRTDVAGAFATPFAAGTPTPGKETQCEFRAGTNSADPAAPFVSLHVQGEVTIASFETSKLTAGGARDVTGVGDQAYYSTPARRLFVRKGVFGFDVGANPVLVPEPDGERRLIALAQLVLERHK